MKKIRIQIGCLLCLAALFSSCSLAHRTLSRADAHLRAGEYQEVLALYAGACARSHDPALRDGYLESVRRIKNTADEAYRKQEFAEAGNIYKILLESAIAVRTTGISLPFDHGYLRAKMDACALALTGIGMMKYREEKLGEAISVWGRVLAFDPDNRTVLKAVQTANKQLRKLKDIK